MRKWLAVAFGAATVLLVALLWLSHMQVTIPTDPEQVCANEDPEKDYDGDGFLNREECNGLAQGQGDATITWPGWRQSSTPEKTKLNPANGDLFIVLVRTPPAPNGTSTTNIPVSPFEYISQAPSCGGLEINVHEIPWSPDPLLNDAKKVLDADRKVVNRPSGSFQKAVKVQESLSASPVLGRCDEEWGTPNGIDNCFVFTKAIKDHIDATCSGLSDKTKCKDTATSAAPSSSPSIYDVYIKHTIAHECGHDMKLRRQYVTQTGGYHYAPTDNLILSQSVDFRKRKTAVDWFIGTCYSLNDQQNFVLWEPSSVP